VIFDPNQDTVARPNELIVCAWRDWSLVADLDAGADRMKWRGEVWLPKEHKEEPGQYRARLHRSDLYPGVKDALDNAVAEPFSKPVQVEELPTELEPLEVNADGDGNDLTQCAKNLMRSACKYGRAHMLVDYTTTNPDGSGVTKAQEAAQNPRAFFRLIEAPQLLGWKTAPGPNGEPIFTEVRIHEIRTVQDGNFGEKKAEFVRVVRRDSYELWRNQAYNPPRAGNGLGIANEARYYDHAENRPQDWVKVDDGKFGPPGGFDSVPLVTVYTGYRGFMHAEPAFKALAETNLTHWQSSSDQRNIVHFARVPVMFAAGFNADELKSMVIAAGAAIASGNPQARLQIIEHSGSAVQVGQDDLNNLERRMEQLGVRPHVERTSGASATGVFLASQGASTDIQAWAQAVDTALEQAFAWAARWHNIELPEAFDVQIFKDYATKLAGAQDITALQADVEKGRITDETYLREAKRRGLYADDLDVEGEVAATQGAKDEAREKALAIAQGKQTNNGQGAGGMPDSKADDKQGNEGGMPPQREAA